MVRRIKLLHNNNLSMDISRRDQISLKSRQVNEDFFPCWIWINQTLARTRTFLTPTTIVHPNPANCVCSAFLRPMIKLSRDLPRGQAADRLGQIRLELLIGVHFVISIDICPNQIGKAVHNGIKVGRGEVVGRKFAEPINVRVVVGRVLEHVVGERAGESCQKCNKKTASMSEFQAIPDPFGNSRMPR